MVEHVAVLVPRSLVVVVMIPGGVGMGGRAANESLISGFSGADCGVGRLEDRGRLRFESVPVVLRQGHLEQGFRVAHEFVDITLA